MNQPNFSLKDIINTLIDSYYFILNRWVLVIIFIIIGGLCGLFFSLLSKPIYSSEFTFVLSNNTKSNGLASIIGQFGLDVSGNNEDAFSGDNIFELFKSKKIIRKALFKNIPNSNNNIINLLVKENYKGWFSKEYLSQYLPFPNTINSISPIQDSLITEIHSDLIKNDLSIDRIDKKLSFYKVTALSTNEFVALYLPKYILQESSDLYIETKTRSASSNLNMLQGEADSLKTLLGNTITLTGKSIDKTFNLNPTHQYLRSESQLGQVKATVLGTAYSEVVKNLEIAKITLQKETPLYQIIDESSFPLKRKKIGKLKSIVFGSILAFLALSIYLMFQNILSEKHNLS